VMLLLAMILFKERLSRLKTFRNLSWLMAVAFAEFANRVCQF